jgi:hypothetical protein
MGGRVVVSISAYDGLKMDIFFFACAAQASLGNIAGSVLFLIRCNLILDKSDISIKINKLNQKLFRKKLYFSNNPSPVFKTRKIEKL